MAPNRYYSSDALPTTLTSPLASTGNPSVAGITGLPSGYPFTVLLDWGLSTQEAISVTSAPTGSGPYVLPCTRGIDGTTAQSHSSGAVAVHGATAQDFNEPQVFLGSFWINVRAPQYGATGNGSTDDTAAIQAAINAAAAAGGGVVYLPHGNYVVSSTLTCSASGVAVIGTPTEQVGAGSMINPTTLAFTVFEFTGSWYVLRDFTIKWNTLTGASGGGATGPVGIWLNGANNTQMSNVQLVHAYNGILVEGGGCNFTGVSVELAAVSDTGRYGICVSGAAGNPNSFNATGCQVSCDTAYTGDGWVQCDGFSSILLYNCYASGCRYAFWSAQNAGPVTSGGTTPSGAVFNVFTAEFCDVFMKLDYGNNVTLSGAQCNSMETVSGGIQIASTWSSSGLVQVSDLEFGPSQGGIYVASAATVIITNAVFQSCTQNPALEITGAADVLVSGLWANPNSAGPAGAGTVQVDSGFTGTLAMTDFALLNNKYGFLVQSGATGTFTLSDGYIGTSSNAAVSLGAFPAGSAISNVTGVPWSFSRYAGVFGDGSDGAVVFDGSTTNSFSSLAGSTYTLTRDFFATSVTISSSVTVNPACFRMFCQGAFVNSGTISDSGASATSASAAAGESSHVFQGGQSGGAGNTGAGSSGSQGTAIACGASGGGGTGSGGAGGGGQGTRGGSGTWLLRTPSAVLAGVSWAATTSQVLTLSGGDGGGGGGGDGTNHGGGGGAGGGVIAILAQTLVNNGTITAAGGAGFTPVTGNCGGGGGGGGGIIVAYTLIAWTAGTTSAAGGSAGSGAGTGTAGTAGSAGSVLNFLVS